MAWRNAKAIDVLTSEVRTKAPGTTVWTIGDDDHAASWSDHNPNECCSVVCAADILDDAGLDLQWLVDIITATNPPALKYVIYKDQIWFPGYGWHDYGGQYHSHVHVSVGWGSDGRSTGPYDDTSPWGLSAAEETPMVPNTPALAVTLSGTTAHLVWDTPKDNGKPINQVIVRVHDRPFPQFPVTEDGSVVNYLSPMGSWGTAYVVQDLKPGKAYYAQVYARNDSGWSSPGSATFITANESTGPVDTEAIKTALRQVLAEGVTVTASIRKA